jgi:hypothetical protein
MRIIFPGTMFIKMKRIERPQPLDSTKLGVGTKVDTTDGKGIIEEIRPGTFPYLVRLQNGGNAWQELYHIISILA